MALSDYVNTFGQYLLQRYDQRVHKIAINAGFTCPNRDGSKGIGGCTFCNNASFNPLESRTVPLDKQICAGQRVIRKRTGARKYLAYFQAYTNTYADVSHLKQQYELALQNTSIIGLCIGTRPDCVPDDVLKLLCHYRDMGYEVWLELGLQSAHDRTLRKVNRGHDFADYQDAIRRIQAHHIPVCTHLILGLPDEQFEHMTDTLQRVLALGVDGLKLHPLHVVKGTQLARQWHHNEYQPLSMAEYTDYASRLIETTPADVIYHRVTGTAEPALLLAPDWCSKKWAVINAIEKTLKQRNSYQGKTCAEDAIKLYRVNEYATGLSRR